MRGWMLMQTGVIVCLSGLWMASQYLRSAVRDPRPGLRLDGLRPGVQGRAGTLRAEPDRRARRVAMAYTGVALAGLALAVFGAVRDEPEEPAPAVTPATATPRAPIPVLLGESPEAAPVGPGSASLDHDAATTTPTGANSGSRR